MTNLPTSWTYADVLYPDLFQSFRPFRPERLLSMPLFPIALASTLLDSVSKSVPTRDGGGLVFGGLVPPRQRS